MNSTVMKKPEKTGHFEPVKDCENRQFSTQYEPLFEQADVKVSHRAGVLAALKGYFEQKRVKKAIL